MKPEKQPPSSSSAMNAADEIIGRPLAQGLGEKIAILDGDQSVSFNELNAAVNRHGNALLKLGVSKGERVLFLLDDSPELIAAYLGTMRIGAVAVALNLRLAPKDLLFVIQNSACRVLYIHAKFFQLYQEIADRIELPPRVVLVGTPHHAGCLALQDFLGGHSAELESAAMAPTDVAFWVYSSGTTGNPKAVMHMHKSVVVADRIHREYFDVKPGDRVFTTSKMFFAFALGHSLIGALRAGATVIVLEGWPDAETIAKVVAQHKPTLLFSVPTMYRNMLNAGCPSSAAFRGIRHFISAGEKLPEGLFERWLEVTGKPITEGIGSSETVFLFLVNDPRQPQLGSCGKKVPWAEVRLMDDDDVEITEAGKPGLLAVRMASQFCGYWKLPEVSERAIRGSWYYPGDMFRFDEQGNWYHLGRADDMLKISGQWVSTIAVDQALLAACGDAVQEMGSVATCNQKGLTEIAVFVVVSPGRDEEARSRLQSGIAALPGFKQPRRVEFVDSLPRTATGKLQRSKLAGLLQQ